MAFKGTGPREPPPTEIKRLYDGQLRNNAAAGHPARRLFYHCPRVFAGCPASPLTRLNRPHPLALLGVTRYHHLISRAQRNPP
jgi:hypothetical protein